MSDRLPAPPVGGHRTRAQLEAELDHLRAAPLDDGRLELVVARPALLQRQVLDVGVLSTTDGLVGDTWSQRPSTRTADGSPHPDMQLNIMGSRVARLVAVTDDRMPLAGDQLYVDLDLSEAALPAGTRLAIGTAVVEITDQPHTGCAKFTERFGLDALRFVNSPIGRELRLRGANAKVVVDGEVRPGDRVRRV
ncbi:MAG TPA: MOSC domain-containing protein [Acidimicrobiaceae bacterium]|nr:MOSC domain-containing protein [Acidimicrobiaceae bacterium]